MTITITTNVTLTACASTCEIVLDNLYEVVLEQREREEERRLFAYLCEYGRRLSAQGINPCSDDFYSDLFKDLHGVRPRSWMFE